MLLPELLLSFLTCAMAVFLSRRAYTGEPTVQLVRAAKRPVLQQVVQILESPDPTEEIDELAEDDERETLLRSFSSSVSGLLGLTLLECVTTLYFLFHYPTLPVVWFLALKMSVVIALAWPMVANAGNALRTVANLSDRAVQWKRISDALSAFCFVLLFLIVNHVIPYES